jgi:hypothetical protein
LGMTCFATIMPLLRSFDELWMTCFATIMPLLRS